MTKAIAWLVLLWMSGWLSLSHPQEDMPPSFVPTPETAKLVLATDEWLVWATSSQVAGTEHERGLTLRMRFYINRNPGEPARFVYEAITSGGYPIAGVLKDRTLVVSKGDYAGGMLLVKPDGTRVEISPPARSTEFGRHGPSISRVSDDGVLLQAYNLDVEGVEPVYFVPWSAGELDFGRKFLVTDEKGARIGWVFRTKEKVATLSKTKLQIFELAARKRVEYPVEVLGDAFKVERLGLQATDAETMIFDPVSVKGVYVTPIFDLRTGKFDVRSNIPGRAIAVKDRIIYSVARRTGEEKKGIWPQLLAATDLDSAGGEAQPLIDVGYVDQMNVVRIIRQDALLIWANKEWKRIPWLSKERVKK